MRFFHTDEGKIEQKPVTVIIPAAGSSRRMGGINKLLLPLDGIPVLIRTLMVFQECSAIDRIILVCRESDIGEYYSLCKEYELNKVFKIAIGGDTRDASVLAGLYQCPEECQWVAVHDAARPFITEAVILDTIAKAQTYGAAAPVVPMKDSIKKVKDGKIVENVAREELGAVQTPQIFQKQTLIEALELVKENGYAVTDDCSAVEYLGLQVAVSCGSYENIKVTTPEDIYLGEAILKHRRGE